jgi:hypothetical protein
LIIVEEHLPRRDKAVIYRASRSARTGILLSNESYVSHGCAGYMWAVMVKLEKPWIEGLGPES